MWNCTHFLHISKCLTWLASVARQKPQLPAAGNSQTVLIVSGLISFFFLKILRRGSPDPWLRGKSHICREFHLTGTSRCHRLSGHDTQESCKPHGVLSENLILEIVIIPWHYYALSITIMFRSHVFKASLTKTCETWRNFDVRPHLLPQWTRL